MAPAIQSPYSLGIKLRCAWTSQYSSDGMNRTIGHNQALELRGRLISSKRAQTAGAIHTITGWSQKDWPGTWPMFAQRRTQVELVYKIDKWDTL